MTFKKEPENMKKRKKTARLKLIGAAILALAVTVGVTCVLGGCGKTKLVYKTELGLNFAVPEDFERTYNYGVDIEYSGDETAFFVDLISYSEYELEYGATVKTCTEAVIDAMNLGGTSIKYDSERNAAQFDTWATDENNTESYYNYITVLPSKNGIFVARYVCFGAEKAIDKYASDFAEMASHLTVVNP